MTKITTILDTQRTPANAKPLGQELSEEQEVEVTVNKSAKEEFDQAKNTYKKVGLGVSGVLLIPLIAGTIRNGLTYPSKFLQYIGDFFGSIASTVAPFIIAKNEINNYSQRNGGYDKNGKSIENFDEQREGFYRTCSLGFTPFIFEPFINPEKFGKSIFHKIATIANIPNLLFTGYTWGAGNAQALLAWGLGRKEQKQKDIAQKEGRLDKVNSSELRAEEYKEIYKSCKRLAVIGSIANPTMQGLRQWADSMALLTGSIQAGEFFQRPLLGLSRLVSLFVGIPETFAKAIDSFVRVVREREHLKDALPSWIKTEKSFSSAANLEKLLSAEDNNIFKSIRHYAEITFHTLSPLSMFALFAPLLDEPHLNEEAQSTGGAPAIFDKVLGRYGKILTTLFTGLYVTFGRLPQFIFQSAYFGKKLHGKLTGNKVTKEDLEQVREKIINSKFVSKISDWAEKRIKKLIPDFYEHGIDNHDGYRTYEEIQAEYAFNHVKETDEFRNNLKQAKIDKKIDPDRRRTIQTRCIEWIKKDAEQGNFYALDDKTTSEIKTNLDKLIDYAIGTPLPKRAKLLFKGAHFLGKYIFKLFDLRTRLQSINYESSHHNMTTAYDNDEYGISFEYELYPVLAKCTHGLRNTVNRLFGVPA